MCGHADACVCVCVRIFIYVCMRPCAYVRYETFQSVAVHVLQWAHIRTYMSETRAGWAAAGMQRGLPRVPRAPISGFWRAALSCPLGIPKGQLLNALLGKSERAPFMGALAITTCTPRKGSADGSEVYARNGARQPNIFWIPPAKPVAHLHETAPRCAIPSVLAHGKNWCG